MLKNQSFENYSVSFLWGNGRHELVFQIHNYDEALKKFNQYKNNKGYNFYRTHARALCLSGWNDNDVELTYIKVIDFKKE